MADKIISLTIIKNTSDNSIERYEVSYCFEYETNTRNAVFSVLASEMTDPSDMNEVKSLANVKATAYKSDWIASLEEQPPVEKVIEVSSEINGEVTLS